MESRLFQYVDKIIRYKRRGEKAWKFGWGCGIHIKSPDDIMMIMDLDEFGQPSGHMKQLRVFEGGGDRVVQIVICEYQCLWGEGEHD